ncbi:MAG: replicative DNA helicase [Sulfobacillus benefaciens]|uniref:Replicative DNA helicase n=1 Tax=Sulfobacillus benefaciens TaxID=453960 RepID=A0A2T2XHI5_9FIRM|nr:MAG: replicative DNA helicase [Sulfobacillus benefaciens]
MSVELGRMPPHSPDAEMSVIGAMLIEPDAVARAVEAITADDFYQENHRKIFEAMVNLFNQGKPVDVVMTGEELRAKNQLDLVGGLPYLMELASLVPTAAHVEYYAHQIKESSVLRRIISISTRLVSEAYQGESTPRDLLDKAQKELFSLTQGGQRDFVRLHEVLLETFNRLELLYANKGKLVGLPTGFPDLDRMTAGLQNSDLIIIAARPSMGKTMLCLNLARYAAIHEQVPVAIFSLEMSREQLALRLLSAEAELSGQRLRTGELDDDMWATLSTALGRLGEAPIFIDDTPGISALELRAKARQLKAQFDIGLVIVDYMQLMQGRRAENRQQEISDISRSLKALAREIDVPVVALSQLSRAVESRTDKRPMLSDLRESGAIEQDADIVAFLYREDYYQKDSENPDVTELIVAKQRNGPTGTVHLLFKKEIGKFLSTAPMAMGYPS